MFESLPLIGFAIALLAVLVLMPTAMKMALRWRFVDRPGGRKDHSGAVPPIGGLMIFSIYMVVCALSGADTKTLFGLFPALLLMLVVGAFDDRRHINAWIKFGAQFVCAGLVVLVGGVQIHHLGNIFGFGTLGMGFMTIPFSIISVVLFVNAINLMDGLDGLAGGQAFVVLVWFMIACVVGGQGGSLSEIAPLLGALGGFLFYNMRSPVRGRAVVFLGDAGSTGLGLVLAWFCIRLTQGDAAVLAPISVAWILALPIIDVCGQFYRRVREGRHPFSPDRGHLHHHFIHAGFSVGRATATILLIGFIMGGVGYGAVALGMPEWVLAVIWIAMLLTHIALSRKPQIYIDFLEKRLRNNES
jgi:UDP-GlcNAc:undecaprenyl-phosphate GlcNAc-1-phosphate transferase